MTESEKINFRNFKLIFFSYKGHRFMKPYYTSYQKFPPLLPVGMWRTDVKITKGLANQSEEEVFRFHDYYEITPKGIIEF